MITEQQFKAISAICAKPNRQYRFAKPIGKDGSTVYATDSYALVRVYSTSALYDGSAESGYLAWDSLRGLAVTTDEALKVNPDVLDNCAHSVYDSGEGYNYDPTLLSKILRVYKAFKSMPCIRPASGQLHFSGTFSDGLIEAVVMPIRLNR